MPISAGGRVVMSGVSSKLDFRGSRNRGQIATGPARKGTAIKLPDSHGNV
jgi:hypothetical protein